MGRDFGVFILRDVISQESYRHMFYCKQNTSKYLFNSFPCRFNQQFSTIAQFVIQLLQNPVTTPGIWEGVMKVDLYLEFQNSYVNHADLLKIMIEIANLDLRNVKLG